MGRTQCPHAHSIHCPVLTDRVAPCTPPQVTMTLKLSPLEENVGGKITVNLDGSRRDGSPSVVDAPDVAEFFNVDALSFRRALQFESAERSGSTAGLASRLPSEASDRWLVPPYGRLKVTEPSTSMISLPPIEEAFLVKIATSLVPLVFAPSELVPTGRMYVVHRGLALLRRRWLGLGQMWGL